MNELELILTDLFNCSRTDLYLNSKSKVFGDREFKLFDKIVKNRAQTIPIQHILGYTEFMGLEFKVSKDVLIPRPETEILVETIIKETKNLKLKTKNLILDIGTGSGCIAISLAKFCNNVEIVATDISKKALDIARQNAKLHNVEDKIRFLESDLFSHNFSQNNIKFDIIVSNPPYVPTKEIGAFDVTTKNEPQIALDGGKDGLDFYRKLSKVANRFLKNNGSLFLEIGFGQASKIREIFSGKWKVKEIRKDYQGIERVFSISVSR